MKNFCKYAGWIILVFSLIIIIGRFEYYCIAYSDLTDISECYPEDYKKVKGIETQLPMLLGCFAQDEMITKDKYGRVKQIRYEYYYVVPICVEDEVYYVGLWADSDDAKEYERISKASLEYMQGEIELYAEEGIKFQGRFIEMEDDMYKRFRKWFLRNGYFEQENQLDEYVLPLVLESLHLEKLRTAPITDTLALVLSILMLIYAYHRDGKEVVLIAKEVIVINNVTYPRSAFEMVNGLIKGGRTERAVKELQWLINVSETEAAAIVQKWDEYCG